jgi:hypothetical protein
VLRGIAVSPTSETALDVQGVKPSADSHLGYDDTANNFVGPITEILVMRITLRTRWRALCTWLKKHLKRLRKLLVKPEFWNLLVSILKFIVWLTKALKDLLQ